MGSALGQGHERLPAAGRYQIVRLSGLSREVADHIPKAVLPICSGRQQAGATGQLSGGHGHKLSPVRHLAQPATRMILMGQRLNLMPLPAQVNRDQFQHLHENHIMMGHGLNLPVVTGFAGTSIVTTC